MTATPEIVHLPGLVLPAEGLHLRDHLLPADQRTPEYLDKYDRHTLIYDCVREQGRDTVLVTAPRFLNLWPLFRDGLRIDGARPRRVRRRTYPKFELVTAPAPRESLTVEIDGHVTPISPREPLAPRFAGLNAVMTMNRNNRLDWIADWLTYHVRAQGLQAVVIHDNGSDAYSLEALAACIASVPGLAAAAVISAPYPYGYGIHRDVNRVSPKFLQSATMNPARVETLSRARAVLNADIDELVTSASGESIFDAAVRRRHIPVKIGGSYAFPGEAAVGGIGHAAHVFRADPPRRANRKWCTTPGGAFSRLGWYVHQTGGELFKLLPNDANFRLVHCSATTTNWKLNPRYKLPERMRHDPELQKLMDTYLAREPAESAA